MGSAYWPQTGEGRVLCLILALYAFAVFGYLTASLASYFLDRDAATPDAAVAGTGDISDLRRDIIAFHSVVLDLQRSGSVGARRSKTESSSDARETDTRARP